MSKFKKHNLWELINHYEKQLMFFVLILCFTVVLVQALMIFKPYGKYLNLTEKLEGDPIDLNFVTVVDSTEFKGFATITIGVDHFASLPYAEVLVNGQEKAAFENNQVTIKVNSGDVVEINSHYYKNPCTFTIENTSKNVIRPEINQSITLEGTRGILGRIVLK